MIPADLPIKIVSVMTGATPGGAEFAAVELLDALVARGNQAIMLSDWDGISRDTDVSSHPLELGPKLSTRSFPAFLALWPLRYLRLRRALEAERPYDVLLLHFKKEQLLAGLLPKRLRQTVVWAEWGPVPRQMQSGIGNRLYAGAGRRAALVLAVSRNTRASTIAAGIDAEKVTVVPNAIRTTRFDFDPEGRARVRAKLGIPATAFVVGCTSRFHPKKRNDVAIDAVLQMGPDTHLILAGEGEAENDLRTWAIPLGTRVHFLPTPDTDAAALFSAFDVCVFCPSPTEGSPTAVILGMLAQRPCIATAPEGVAELIDAASGTIISPENDPLALSLVLAEYAADPERIRREGAIAADRASERFAADKVAAGVERLLAAAIGERRR